MDTAAMDATEVALNIKQGNVTSEHVVTSALDRIEAVDPELGAFVTVMRQRAIAVARARDIEASAGYIRGPLHGVPVAVKDLFDVEGIATGAGSRCLVDNIAAKSAQAVVLLEQAGAVIVGKTQTVEFAFGGWGTNPVLKTPKNPHDQDMHRVAGGSSSGSAVAVASGMVPLALGTDTGGSVRIPAAFCGVFGHKSSLGLIGRSGVFPLSTSHDTVGPIARSARDIRLATTLLSGRDPKDPATAAQPGPGRRGCLRNLKIAVLDDPSFQRLDPQVASVFDKFISDLRTGMGYEVQSFTLPVPLEDLCAVAGNLMSAESYANLRPYTENPENDIAPAIRDRVNRGRHIPSYEFLEILQKKSDWTQQFNDCFSSFDILLAPGAPILPPPMDEVDESNMILSVFGRFVNLLNLCGTSVPIALSKEGLPIGVQIVGRHYDDALTLDFAVQLEDRKRARFLRPLETVCQ